MSNKNPTETSVQFERLSDACLEFRLNNVFVTDGNLLFVAPNDDFCRFCFQRRYLTQTKNQARTDEAGDKVLKLARKLDGSNSSGYWQAFAVQNQNPVATFEFTTYEDCPNCGTQETHSREDAKAAYENLLTQETKPKMITLNQQVFSFGFASGRTTTQQTGLPNPEYDKLLGDNYHSKIIFTMVSAIGKHADYSCTGFAKNKELAELKALMEYLERYAFTMKVCRYKTTEHDDQIINRFLELYSDTPAENELSQIEGEACWGINLASNEIHAIPLSFIFSQKQDAFIQPSSSGFGAHTDFKKSLCSSVLELVERDAYVRFWHDPQRAFNFEPDINTQSSVNEIISILKKPVGNEKLVSQFYVLQSPARLPVVLATISSSDPGKPPSLNFGCSAGFNLNEALMGALEELRLNATNLVKAITVFDGFLTRKFTGKIESIPDRMNFYSTSIPRAKLKFLDSDNPLSDGIAENAEQDELEILVDRFKQIDFDVYGIDCTPECFQNKNVFVTRAFCPQLYPMQFEQENAFSLTASPTSAQKILPHFFI